MIYKLCGEILKAEENQVILKVNGITYEVNTPKTVYLHITTGNLTTVDLIIYHYFLIEKNKGIPVLVGFVDELERDFFIKFISVSGVGPKAALRAFDKPVPRIAAAIEEGDVDFLQTLAGIGNQRAKQIVAHLQGKVGRFALIKEDRGERKIIHKEIVGEAKEILKRLQYSNREAEEMIRKAIDKQPKVNSVEELLNEIYRQRK